MHSCQNGTSCRDGVKVLWCCFHLVWLSSIPTCTCFYSENYFVTCSCFFFCCCCCFLGIVRKKKGGRGGQGNYIWFVKYKALYKTKVQSMQFYKALCRLYNSHRSLCCSVKPVYIILYSLSNCYCNGVLQLGTT